MAFKAEYGNGIPKGRLVPVYLTEEGELYPVVFASEDQMELVSTMIGIAMEHKVVVDTNTLINDPKDKLSVYNLKTKKKL